MIYPISPGIPDGISMCWAWGLSWTQLSSGPSDPFGSLRQAGADKNHRERPALDTAVRWCLGSLLVWYLVSGWWFGTYMGYFIFPYIGIFIIPTDEVIFLQRGRYTTNQVYCSGILRICLDFWTLESLEHAEFSRNVKHKTLASNHGLGALGTISGFWILGDEIIPGFEKTRIVKIRTHPKCNSTWSVL